jgi:hypothetical protein
MRARKPLQLAPRTVTSDTIRSRSTYNNDLYGGARPREAVLAARDTTRQYPRYPSAAHISLAASCLASHSHWTIAPSAVQATTVWASTAQCSLSCFLMTSEVQGRTQTTAPGAMQTTTLWEWIAQCSLSCTLSISNLLTCKTRTETQGPTWTRTAQWARPLNLLLLISVIF